MSSFQINNNPTTLPDGVVKPLPVPRELFCSIAIDLAGPLPSDNQKELIIFMLDRFTRFTYVIPPS